MDINPDSAIESLVSFLQYNLASADQVLERFLTLPNSLLRGEDQKRFVYVPGTRKDRVLLVAHADTEWDESYTKIGDCIPVIRRVQGILHSGRQGVGIGADDRAGCAILWILRSLGHSLLIADGEEGGQEGSHHLADSEENASLHHEIESTHQFAVEFDLSGAARFKCYDRGTDSFRLNRIGK